MTKCKIHGCKNTATGRGWCHAHYMRWYHTGNVQADVPLQKKAPMGALFQYYCEHVQNATTDECMRWPFAYNSRGRAVMKVGDKQVRVHRYTCEEKNGPPPTPEHHAAHNCGHDWCINPNHVRWATPSENNQDKLAHGTHNRGERHNLAKLTEDQVQEIRRLEGRESQSSLARRFGVSAWHVNSIQKHIAWSWLDNRDAA